LDVKARQLPFLPHAIWARWASTRKYKWWAISLPKPRVHDDGAQTRPKSCRYLAGNGIHDQTRSARFLGGCCNMTRQLLKILFAPALRKLRGAASCMEGIGLRWASGKERKFYNPLAAKSATLPQSFSLSVYRINQSARGNLAPDQVENPFLRWPLSPRGSINSRTGSPLHPAPFAKPPVVNTVLSDCASAWANSGA